MISTKTDGAVLRFVSKLYKGHTIQVDPEKGNLIIFPTDAGIQHDYDRDSEGWHYCGNCKWAYSIEEAEDIIDEIV